MGFWVPVPGVCSAKPPWASRMSLLWGCVCRVHAGQGSLKLHGMLVGMDPSVSQVNTSVLMYLSRAL